MKVKDDINFRSEYPEMYPWGRIDSMKYSNLCCELSYLVKLDLRTADRLLVPGLRKALNILAEKADA